ncbi:MAG: hypothetical protein AUK47_16290 [Deltaproteobacteria bacterium CG2_30_63_29]|nr:MAG: hypothetical protein AUK47_16290 [Deltaproteobacteria bacterium CG2_30_63_29]
MPTRLVLSLILALTCWTPTAFAQDDANDSRPGDPHDGSTTWMQPVPAIQIEADPTLQPTATGGIFVPAMTDPIQEPRYTVLDDDDMAVDSTDTGRVTYVSPGMYTVLVGSGDSSEMLEFEVRVVEGRITTVPVEWAGLIVTVVDERGTPFRGSYELVRMPEREYVGLGLGASLSEGEQLDTWLLWPGTYLILAAGESYQARKNFTTLRLPAGQLVQYTVVMDTVTGDLLGAGEVALAPEVEDGWDINVVLGGSVQFNQADNVVGKSQGQNLDLASFIETVGAFLSDNHLGYGRLNIEVGGRIVLPDNPFVTNVDELRLDLLYAYRLTDWFGPYVRSSAETNMFPGYQLFDTPTDVRRLDDDGDLIRVEEGALDVRLTNPFSLIDISGGSGVRFDLDYGNLLQVNTRFGIGIRQVFARNVFIIETNSAETNILEKADFGQFGAEGAVVLEFNPTRWALLKLDTSLLAPFDDFSNPFLELRATLALRLSSIASLNYTVKIVDDPQLLDATQIDQTILLRFAYKLL